MEFLDSNSREDRLSERSLKLKSLSVSVAFSLSPAFSSTRAK